ncbi:MAG: ATP-binding protein [Phycisphaerae bacterium]|nr:ATP-binding protein [Phycisphaerae bacterium]MDD5380571.1 ATP-binding protein [Phycisphaerae bacterium]
MRIGQKSILFFIGIASLVGIIGVIAIKYNANIAVDVDQILLSNSNEAKAATEIAYHIQRIQTNINKLLLGRIDETPEHKKIVKNAVGESVSKLQQFTLLWEDAIKLKIELFREEKQSEEVKTFEDLKTKVDGFIPLVSKTAALQEEQGSEVARSFFESKVEPLLLETQKTAEKLIKSTRQRPITKAEEIRKAVGSSTESIIISTIVGLLAVIVVCHFIWSTISNPIIKLKDAADKIGQGELETQIQVSSKDEIGDLARAFNDMTCKLKEARTILEEKVRQRTEGLSAINEELQNEIGEHLLVQEKLQQHIRHLSCFYALSKLIEQPGISLEEIFKQTVTLIRYAYQHSEKTCVRITFEGINYKTDNFRKSEYSQYAKLKVEGYEVGAVEVYRLEEKQEDGQSPFLKEEDDLLNAVTEQLGRVASRKQTSEKLELLRNLIDRSNDCIFIMEPKWGRLLDTNDRACDSLGYMREELLKMAFKDIEQSIPDDAFWQVQMKELKLRGDLVIQGRHKRSDGTTFFAETSLKLVSQNHRDGSCRKEDFIIAIARNVSERMQAEQRQAQLIQELERTNHEVAKVNKELKDFAYIVSHDLKAPLRGIKTVAEWISADYADKLDETGKEQMKLLTGRVDRMHNLIDGILQYSKVGHAEEEKVAVNLNELVAETIDVIAPPENITITIEDELPTVECEHTRIMQVFQNLLSNAVKYMDKPKGQIKVGCVEENGFWKFSVADNGRGIEKKHYEKVFQLFQTLSPRDKFENTGIGLTVTKKIVELYDGKIWVESKPGQGSTFFFTLPKQEMGVKNAKLEANVVG